MKHRQNAGGYDRLKIGSNIRKWRGIKQIKQKDLAHALQLSEAAISNIENDLTDVSLSQLEDISITLQLELEQLFIDPELVMQQHLKPTIREQEQRIMFEPEWYYSLIGNLQKKDDEIKHVLDEVMNKLSLIEVSKSRENHLKN
jgi:transcriptional regulator with XRE-family HTH domain